MYHFEMADLTVMELRIAGLNSSAFGNVYTQYTVNTVFRSVVNSEFMLKTILHHYAVSISGVQTVQCRM